MLENTEGAIKSGKSRETGNIGYTRRRKTQRNWQHRVHKTKKKFKQSHNMCWTPLLLHFKSNAQLCMFHQWNQ